MFAGSRGRLPLQSSRREQATRPTIALLRDDWAGGSMRADMESAPTPQNSNIFARNQIDFDEY